MELLPLKKLDETEVKFEKNVYNSKLWPDVFETSILGCLFELQRMSVRKRIIINFLVEDLVAKQLGISSGFFM